MQYLKQSGDRYCHSLAVVNIFLGKEASTAFRIISPLLRTAVHTHTVPYPPSTACEKIRNPLVLCYFRSREEEKKLFGERAPPSPLLIPSTVRPYLAFRIQCKGSAAAQKCIKCLDAEKEIRQRIESNLGKKLNLAAAKQEDSCSYIKGSFLANVFFLRPWQILSSEFSSSCFSLSLFFSLFGIPRNQCSHATAPPRSALRPLRNAISTL